MDPRFLKSEGWEAFTGNELILKGCLEAGVNLLTGYPGSPVADVFDVAMRQADGLRRHGLLAEIAGNEALAAARLNGSQMMGLNAVAVMKSVGFNVAADGLFVGTLAKHGHKGGAVVVVGDDPWNDSTQVPQDSRRLSDHVLMPSLEPATFQEVKDMVGLGLELSRRSDLYVSVIVSTNLADGGAVVKLKPHPGLGVSPAHLGSLDVASLIPAENIVMPPHTGGLEKEAYDLKFPAALKAARDLGLNAVDAGQPGIRLGFVAAGLCYSYLREMLREAGMEGRFPILRLGMTFPLEPEICRDFAKGLDEIIVIETKRAFIETQLRDLLVRAKQHGIMDALPAVWGKDFPDGFSGMPAEHGMNSSVLLKRLGPFLQARHLGTPGLELGLQRIEAASFQRLQVPSRTATFCSGCPHRDSSTVFNDLAADFNNADYMQRVHQRPPIDLVFHGDAGCYTMLFLPPNQRLMQNYSGMGLGGGSAAGLDPFVVNKSVTFIGDGTFFHSGLAAASDSIKNNADLLYVVLDNKTTAMTGHQPNNGTDKDVMGDGTYAQDCEQALLGLTQGSQIPVVRVNPELREEYRAAIEDLLLLDGPKFLIADKECGITYHRRKRRAAAAEEQKRGFLAVEEHVLVNEDACEHCLECTSKTGCPGLDFVDTLHGPKVQTHASHCVNDLACARIKACPSFEKVVVRRKKAPKRPVADIRDVPTPTLAQPGPDGVWRAYMAGIGGMGIGATTALLVRAAQEMGYYVQFCDKKGIAIRGGGVYAHVAITKQPMVLSPVHPYGSADLLVGVDLLEAARSVDATHNLRVASPERTRCVVNSTRHPTTRALMGIESWDNATLEAALKERSLPGGYWSGETSPLCQEYLGSTLYDNSLLMGAAYQLGLLPVTSQSLHKALKAAYTGVARSRNLQAFNIGREMVAHPERYGRPAVQNSAAFITDKQARLEQSHGRSTAAGWRQALDQAFTAWPIADEQERKHLALSSYELVHFEDLGFSLRYLDLVKGVAAKDSAASGWLATKAAAKGLYKVMAIKDEGWAAHLLTSPEKYERDKLRLNLGDGDKVEYVHFNRPHFDVMGLKLEFDLNSRDWMLKLMKKGKFLRRILPGWHRRERGLRDWYLGLVQQYPGAGKDDARWVELLSLIQDVKGYREVRWKGMDKAYARATELGVAV